MHGFTGSRALFGREGIDLDAVKTMVKLFYGITVYMNLSWTKKVDQKDIKEEYAWIDTTLGERPYSDYLNAKPKKWILNLLQSINIDWLRSKLMNALSVKPKIDNIDPEGDYDNEPLWI